MATREEELQKKREEAERKEKDRDKSFLTLHLFPPLCFSRVLDIDISPQFLTDN